MDRVIQQAIAQVLTPIFDPTFSESSFGFRPGRKPCRPHPRQRRGLFMLSAVCQPLQDAGFALLGAPQLPALPAL